MNEKFAPELLESKAEIVECVMEQLEHMVRITCLWTLEKAKTVWLARWSVVWYQVFLFGSAQNFKNS